MSAALAATGTPAPTSADKKPKILCVDDDQNILDGFRRHLRTTYNVFTATTATEGLEIVARDSDTFPVVVSDFKMPGMNGIQFLTQVRTMSPDSVRIMLTGQADTTTAINAVNQGNIFRFLVKPCLPVVLAKILEAGMEQHRLVISERQLTQETLLGSVSVLVEVMSMLKPEAFSRATRVRRYVKHIAAELKTQDPWQWEVAAMLSQIGWITLPTHLLGKAAAGDRLNEYEREQFAKHASSASKTILKIPRLELVAKMIDGYLVPFQKVAQKNPDWKALDAATLGAQVLRAAIDFDALRNDGRNHVRTIETLNSRPGEYCPGVLDILAALESTEAMQKVLTVRILDLKPGMIAEEDILNDAGLVLLGKGQEVTETVAERLSHFHLGLSTEHTCRVRVPD